MAWVTQGACAGHSAAPHASNQELSNKGGSAPPPPQHQLGAWKPLRDQQGRLLLGRAASRSSVPGLGASANKLPFGKHMPVGQTCVYTGRRTGRTKL